MTCKVLESSESSKPLKTASLLYWESLGRPENRPYCCVRKVRTGLSPCHRCFLYSHAMREMGRNLLSHACKRLAPYSIPTFKVSLRIREVDCTSSERTFLQNPTTFVQRALQHVSLEVVDWLAYVKWLFRLSLNSDIL
jgi:hypothetical protein